MRPRASPWSAAAWPRPAKDFSFSALFLLKVSPRFPKLKFHATANRCYIPGTHAPLLELVRVHLFSPFLHPALTPETPRGSAPRPLSSRPPLYRPQRPVDVLTLDLSKVKVSSEVSSEVGPGIQEEIAPEGGINALPAHTLLEHLRPLPTQSLVFDERFEEPPPLVTTFCHHILSPQAVAQNAHATRCVLLCASPPVVE